MFIQTSEYESILNIVLNEKSHETQIDSKRSEGGG